MLTGNKGEWSEVYTLLKVISDRNLFAGDQVLNRIEGLLFPIIKVLREESNGTYEYTYDDHMVVINGRGEEFRIPIVDFQNQAAFLLSKLKGTTNSTFSVNEVEEFMSSFKCDSLKSKSTIKSDIRIVIHDQRTGTTPSLGFSIKSQVGGASTLLNAAKTTNFIYKVGSIDLSDDHISLINDINTKSKIRDRIKKIHEASGELNFVGTENPIFSNNLTLIDSSLPRILSEVLKLYFSSKATSIADLVDEVSKLNPIIYDNSNDHPFYKYKMKRFLTDVALGMMPSKVWKGTLDATGGYLVVKEDGEVLCYHIYNRNDFEDYLLNNTRLETASSKRHGFGSLYRNSDGVFLNLNLQIRFVK